MKVNRLICISLFLLCVSISEAQNFDLNVTNYLTPHEDGKEVFARIVRKKAASSTPISTDLNYPWEIFNDGNGFLWVTEARGYQVTRFDINNNFNQRLVLDISASSTDFPIYKVEFSGSQGPSGNKKWPQGGLMGLALHPDFYNPTNPKRFVYLAYVKRYLGFDDGTTGPTKYTNPNGPGFYFESILTRWEFNPTTNVLESPLTIMDNIPGSSDHNSGRLAIGKVNGQSYMFYSVGDMGAGQFENGLRKLGSQNTSTVEGKILRFNLEADAAETGLAAWIPNDGLNISTSPIYSIGHRNPQGIVSANINGVDLIYSGEHGQFSDDELNVIEAGKNYGHPLIMGYPDGNYDGVKAGKFTGTNSTVPLINESVSLTDIGITNYRAPIFTFYPGSKTTITNIYNASSGFWNDYLNWPSEAIAGIDFYGFSNIPGWKNSILSAALKGGKILRTKLSADGRSVIKLPVTNSTLISNKRDSAFAYFYTDLMRFRDLALSNDGRSIYTVFDNGGQTSGPTANTSNTAACAGCLIEYKFIGYAKGGTAGNTSTVPASVPIGAASVSNTCEAVTTITIDGDNGNNYWVPITDNNGNLIAEIDPRNQIIGKITTSVYNHSGAVRQTSGGMLYANRTITIKTPTGTVINPATKVGVRLYLSGTEFAALQGATNALGPSGVTTSNLAIYKTETDCDGNFPAVAPTAVKKITPTVSAFGSGYVLEFDVTEFSSFFFANGSFSGPVVLPTKFKSVKAALQREQEVAITWEAELDPNFLDFVVEWQDEQGNWVPVSQRITAAPFQALHTVKRSGVHLYRVRATDKPNAITYSKVVSVNIAAGELLQWKLSPNPTVANAQLLLERGNISAATVEIRNAQGVLLQLQQNINLQAGQTLQLPVQQLSAQWLLVQVRDKEGRVIWQSKLLKQ